MHISRKGPMLAAVAVILALTGLLVACAVNPATGKRQFVLISEGQEIAMGREYDKQVSAEMGLYGDAELQAYVDGLGQKLAAGSERPELDWKFSVVDDPMVNAFALPGGYIYITRGILAHFNSEAELAAVLGHEIGHVTGRHSVSQMSKSQLLQLGLGVGAVMAPERWSGLTEVAAAGLGVLFLKYGRDDEREADDLGLRYMLSTGYDPRRMTHVFEMLGRVSAAQGGGRVPGWQSTHPAPENRRERIAGQISGLPDQDFSDERVGRKRLLTRVDGIVFGENPRDGYFEDSLFFHPEMQFRFEFPAGWKTINQRSAVVGVSKEQDAIVMLGVAGEESAAAALTAFFADEGVSKSGAPMGSINGLTTAGGGFTVTTESGSLTGRVGFIEYRGSVFRLIGYSPGEKWEGYRRTIRGALASFNRVTDRRVLDVQPRRLKTVKLDREMTVESFAERYGASIPVDTLRVINGLDPGDRLASGRTYKVVTGGPDS